MNVFLWYLSCQTSRICKITVRIRRVYYHLCYEISSALTSIQMMWEGYFILIIYTTLINCFYHRDKNITFTSLSSIVRKAVALEKLRYFAELSSSASRNFLSLKTCEERQAHSVLEDSIKNRQANFFLQKICPNFSGQNFFRLYFDLIGFSRLLVYSLNWKNFDPRFCRYCNKQKLAFFIPSFFDTQKQDSCLFCTNQ